MLVYVGLPQEQAKQFVVDSKVFAVVRNTLSDSYAVCRGHDPNSLRTLLVARVAFGYLLMLCR